MSSKVQIMPHRTASTGSVIWGSWTIETGNDSSNVSQNVQSWDFSSVCRLSAEVMIDRELFLGSTGIGSMKELSLVAQVECPATYLRTIERLALSDDGHAVQAVTIDLPPGSYASHLVASLHIVLNEDCPDRNDPTVARAKGARLAASDPFKLQLDGSTSRFPTDALPFSGILPSEVPWMLNVTYADLDDAFLGAVRLLINTAHPAGRAALDDNHPAVPVVRSALAVDVTRSLLQQIAAHENHSIPRRLNEFDPSSVGYVAASMCVNQLNGSLESIIQMMKNDPSEFEVRIQSSLSYLNQVEG